MQLGQIAVWPRAVSPFRVPSDGVTWARLSDVWAITRPCRTDRLAPSSEAVNHGSTFLESFRCNTSAFCRWFYQFRQSLVLCVPDNRFCITKGTNKSASNFSPSNDVPQRLDAQAPRKFLIKQFFDFILQFAAITALINWYPITSGALNDLLTDR